MLTVYKYLVPFDDVIEIDLPVGARLLSFQNQHEQPCLWALVDPHVLSETRRFRLCGTGHEINATPERLVFIGTAQFNHGTLVFHLFELLPSTPHAAPHAAK